MRAHGEVTTSGVLWGIATYSRIIISAVIGLLKTVIKLLKTVIEFTETVIELLKTVIEFLI
jgi:hypothetical protein